MPVPARKQLAPRSPKWSEVEEKVAADMLLRGFKCAEVAAVLFRKPYEVYGWLYRQRERFNWQVPDEVIFVRILGREVTVAAQERALREFRPMLMVDVMTGQVKLDRLKEVLGYEYSVN
ncbi:MAG TPA: hypothetical protein GXX23_02710 [Firmicutes bacterium]|nr:hypothetical protein [Candidatus Fermentithermobacillaceae bacterium]